MKMTKNQIICEILEQTTPDELMFDIENSDIEYLAWVARDVVFQGTVNTNDILDALVWFASQELEALN